MSVLAADLNSRKNRRVKNGTTKNRERFCVPNTSRGRGKRAANPVFRSDAGSKINARANGATIPRNRMGISERALRAVYAENILAATNTVFKNFRARAKRGRANVILNFFIHTVFGATRFSPTKTILNTRHF